MTLQQLHSLLHLLNALRLEENDLERGVLASKHARSLLSLRFYRMKRKKI